MKTKILRTFFKTHTEQLNRMGCTSETILDNVFQVQVYESKENKEMRTKIINNIIKNDVLNIYLFARYILKDRIPECERTVAKDPYYGLLYTYHVLKSPWDEYEKNIAKMPKWQEIYKEYFINIINRH